LSEENFRLPSNLYVLPLDGEGWAQKKEMPDSPLCGGVQRMDLKYFIGLEAFNLIMRDKGWTLSETKKINNNVCFKPDFYESGFIIAKTPKAKIVCVGETIVIFNSKEYNSVESLIADNEGAIDNFSSWEFKEEKEWVVFKYGTEWTFSFTTINKFPKTTKLRC